MEKLEKTFTPGQQLPGRILGYVPLPGLNEEQRVARTVPVGCVEGPARVRVSARVAVGSWVASVGRLASSSLLSLALTRRVPVTNPGASFARRPRRARPKLIKTLEQPPPETRG